MTDQSLYSPEWFKKQKTGSVTSAEVVLPLVVDFVAPKSVVDVGCGVGGWLKFFLDRGIKDVTGVDGDWVDEAQLLIPKEAFKKLDVRQPFDIGKKADLAICLEVGEHLSETSAQNLVNNLTKIAPVVLFSAAIPHQPGTGHINGQWPEYWAALFEKNGYVTVDCLRRRVWTNPDVEYWYAQNMIMYVKQSELGRYPKLKKEIECGYSTALPLVHPRRYYYALKPLPPFMFRVVRKIKFLLGKSK